MGIIALFVFLIEAIAVTAFKFSLDKQPSLGGPLVIFIVAYPVLITIGFFTVLWFRPEHFFGPGDFREDASFIGLIRKVERIEVRQHATQLASAPDIDALIPTIRKLLDNRDVETAIYVGNSQLKEKKFETALKVFNFLKEHVSESNPSFYRILSNTAYGLIGIGHFAEARDQLLTVHTMIGNEEFRAWHAVALAYCYNALGDATNAQQWLAFARSTREFPVSIDWLISLYPEIAAEIVGSKRPNPNEQFVKT
jgi:hypothetical protein